MMEQTIKLMINRGVIIKCPSCSCYLIKLQLNRIGSAGVKYKVYQCMLCLYSFSENVAMSRAKDHYMKMKGKLTRALAQKRKIETEINNLQFMIMTAEENPKLYNK